MFHNWSNGEYIKMHWSTKDIILLISIFVYVVRSHSKNYSPKDVLLRPNQLWQIKQ